MATWRDGPRYAPTDRPVGFAAPAQAVSLEPAEQATRATTTLPAAAPNDYQQPTTTVPLAQIVPIPQDVRDPRQPFATISSAMTSGASAVSGTSGATAASGDPAAAAASPVSQAIQRTPYQPIQVSHTGAGLADLWAPPPPPKPTVTRPAPLSECWAAGYPPLLISLIVSAVIAPTGNLLPLFYLVAVPWLMVPRVRHRVRQLKQASWIIVGILLGLWLTAFFLDSTFYNVDLGLPLWTCLGCAALLVVDLLLQRQAIRHGESSGAPGVARAKININQASAAALETLPGVGPVIAQAIVDWRRQYGQFTSITQLQYVRGIGPNNYAQIEPHITI